MSNTPYFDAYEKIRKSKEQCNFSIRKKYITLSTGENVLKDVEFLDEFGNKICTIDEYVLR